MKTFTKALVGTVAAGAMAVSAATPALARDNGGIRAGEVIAGALIIGGIAAIAASAGNGNSGYSYNRAGYNSYGNRGYGNSWGHDNPRNAVQACIQAAERTASRHSFGGRANVTDVRDVRETRWGYEVRGRIAVNAMGRNWRHGDANYGRGWGNDYRGWNSAMRGWDSGTFTCKVERGRIADLDFRGIRGL